MTAAGEHHNEPAEVFGTWMKSATDFWLQMAGSMMPQPESGTFEHVKDHVKDEDHGDADHDPLAGSAAQVLAASMTAAGALASAMGQPDSLVSSLKSVTAIPDIILKMIQPAFDNLAEMTGKMTGQMGKSAQYAISPGVDRQAFRIWHDVYDSEFRKFINIPQLGLMRYHQEKFSQFFDCLGQLETIMAGFLQLVFQPLYDSFATFQEQIAEKSIRNGLPEDLRSYYTIWIKILEGHYMRLLRSPEYLKMLSEALNAASAYAKARRELVNDLLQYLSLPSISDFEEMQKELYLLKKRIGKIEKATRPYGGES